MPPRKTTQKQALVQQPQDRTWRLTRFVNTAQGPNRERCVHCGGQPLAGYVAQVEPDGAIRKLKIIQKISAHFVDRVKLMRDCHFARTKRFLRQHRALDQPGLVKLCLTLFVQFVEFAGQRGDIHTTFRRERFAG